MARAKPDRLTPLETMIMKALWEASPASVRQVQQRLESVKPMAYNTVLTMMRILRDKGFVTSQRDGRTDLYDPVVSREHMGQRSYREAAESFFAGSAQALVSHLLNGEELSEEELKTLRGEINQRLKTQRKGDDDD